LISQGSAKKHISAQQTSSTPTQEHNNGEKCEYFI